MDTLAARPPALDESAYEFISTFMAHVTMVAGYGQERSEAIAGAKRLLIAALEEREGASETAWSLLHRTIARLVATANVSHDARSARAYLLSFVQENVDLAVCVPSTAATLMAAAPSQPARAGSGDPIHSRQLFVVGGISCNS